MNKFTEALQSIFTNDKKGKQMLTTFIITILILSILLFTFDVLSQNKDGRTQIISDDPNGAQYSENQNTYTGTSTSVDLSDEVRLKNILSKIKGVGTAEVMITYKIPSTQSSGFSVSEDKYNEVEGVIIVADGASDTVVKNNIITSVSSVFNIPVTKVNVFEKN